MERGAYMTFELVVVLSLATCYVVMAFLLGKVFIDHVTSERRPILESGYWATYDYKEGMRPKKRTYFVATVAGILWPLVFIYGIIDIAMEKKNRAAVKDVITALVIIALMGFVVWVLA
jgi:hypothetical protein